MQCHTCGIEYQPAQWQLKQRCHICRDCFKKKRKEYYQRPEVKERHRNYAREYERKRWQNPQEKLKMRARRYLHKAVAEGRLQRLPCAVCGDPETHGHHEDYAKPLEVIWLCQRCHYLHHNPPQ